MTASIERNVYVLRRELPNPIHYVRGTNAISLIFHFRDIEIPSGVTAQVYVRKPSGKEVYNTAVISGSDVTVDVTTQMFIETGMNVLQVQINQEEENLVTFEYPVIVHENYTEGDAEKSENESTLLQQYVDEVAQAAEDAKNEVRNEVTAGKNDLDDYVEALKETIPADYTELSESVEQLERNKAPAIIEEASGAEITLDDSGPAPVKDLQLYGYSRQTQTTGAQLIKYPYLNSNGVTNNGITYTVSDDGVITANGTATDQSIFFMASELSDWRPSGEVFLSGCPSGGSPTTYRLQIFNYNGEKAFAIDNGKGAAANFTNTDAQWNLCIRIASGYTANNLVFEPMLNAGTSALPWEPYSGGYASPSPDWAQPIHSVADDVTVESQGANLIEFGPNQNSVTSNGITFKNLKDGKILVTGTCTADSYVSFLVATQSQLKLANGTYFLSGCPAGGSSSTFYLQMTNATASGGLILDTGNGASVDFAQEGKSYGVFIVIRSGYTANNLVFKPMLNRGSTPLPWQPYVAPSSALITLTDSLRGIPVSSGGNYTDEDGQQWIADYIYRRQTDGKWMLWRNCIEVPIDGSTRWTYNTQNDILIQFTSWSALQKDPPSLFSNIISGVGVGNQLIEGVWIHEGATLVLCLKKILLSQETTEGIRQWCDENPFHVVYQLATPTIEELPDDVQAELNGLMTYNLHSDMWNSDNAHMALKYVADTKSYIDKKIAEISDAIIERLN